MKIRVLLSLLLMFSGSRLLADSPDCFDVPTNSPLATDRIYETSSLRRIYRVKRFFMQPKALANEEAYLAEMQQSEITPVALSGCRKEGRKIAAKRFECLNTYWKLASKYSKNEVVAPGEIKGAIANKRRTNFRLRTIFPFSAGDSVGFSSLSCQSRLE